MRKRKNKSTSFNLECAYDKSLLDYAERKENGKFSEYIKRLIHMDREGVRAAPTIAPVAQVENESKDDFAGFI